MRPLSCFFCAALGFSALQPISAFSDDASNPPPADPKGVSFGGFVDGYYIHDYNDPDLKNRPYTTQALRDNEPRLNLGYLDAKLDEESWRGRLAVQYGDSVYSNYSSEKDRLWRYFQEATAGYKINDKLWLDAGIYLSHIGFESFNSKDNWNYTRSLVGEYSPYYETGAKLTYQLNDNLTGQMHVLKGWQNISQDRDPALGLQLAYTPTKSSSLTYANFIGNEHGMRNFHDFIGKLDVTGALSMALQFDAGNQNISHEGGNVWWHGWSLMSRYKVATKLAVGGRVERYSDPHQVVLSTVNGKAFNATGLSVNVDYEIAPSLFWRSEYRVLFGRTAVFPKEGGDSFSKHEALIVTSLSYAFELGGLS